MNITLMTLSAIVKNRLSIVDASVQEYKDELIKYKYPIGIFPFNLIQNNPIYEAYPAVENVAYIRNLLITLYSDFYTDSELAIVEQYVLQSYEPQFELSDSTMSTLALYLGVNSQKPEIQFFLDEMRYNYVGTLLYSNSSETELINSLLTQLKEIENAHNVLQLELPLRKDEYK